MSSPRLVVIPVALFVGVSGSAFGLAKLHLARPSFKAPASIKLGDFYNGQTIFSKTCAACHGQDGEGGGVGPKLAGAPITLEKAAVQIESGGSAMPPGLVKGKAEADVLAYLATIIKPPSS